MTEFLIPALFSVEGEVGLSVKFAGLNESEYDILEIALEDGPFQAVERNADNMFESCPTNFTGLDEWKLYKVNGRTIASGRITETYALIPAHSNTSEPMEISHCGGVLEEIPSPPLQL